MWMRMWLCLCVWCLCLYVSVIARQSAITKKSHIEHAITIAAIVQFLLCCRAERTDEKYCPWNVNVTCMCTSVASDFGVQKTRWNWIWQTSVGIGKNFRTKKQLFCQHRYSRPFIPITIWFVSSRNLAKSKRICVWMRSKRVLPLRNTYRRGERASNGHTWHLSTISNSGLPSKSNSLCVCLFWLYFGCFAAMQNTRQVTNRWIITEWKCRKSTIIQSTVNSTNVCIRTKRPTKLCKFCKENCWTTTTRRHNRSMKEIRRMTTVWILFCVRIATANIVNRKNVSRRLGSKTN